MRAGSIRRMRSSCGVPLILRAGKAGDDREQLVDAVRAAMARADRLEPAADEFGAQRGIVAKPGEMFGHPLAIARDEIVLAGAEQPLGIFPWCRYQGDPAG